jgi:protein farnesyltransferase subunit beta
MSATLLQTSTGKVKFDALACDDEGWPTETSLAQAETEGECAELLRAALGIPEAGKGDEPGWT